MLLPSPNNDIKPFERSFMYGMCVEREMVELNRKRIKVNQATQFSFFTVYFAEIRSMCNVYPSTDLPFVTNAI